MPDIATHIAITMTQGMSIEIGVDNNIDLGKGEFARVNDENKDTIDVNGTPRQHILGFVSEYPEIGSISLAASDEFKDLVAVKYTQLQSLPNRIFFVTEEGTQHTVSIVTIPIHDHSSIYQGGPAYGAYAFDKVVEDTEGA